MSPGGSARFVVISGLPCSGKTTLGRQLAAALELPLLDKDEMLDRLFEDRGVGDRAWRRRLSRESDGIFEREAAASGGAVIVSFWHVPGMTADSGTPAHWLADLPGPVVHVQCVCAPEIAAARFLQHADRLFALAPILEVHLSRSRERLEALAHCHWLLRLRHRQLVVVLGQLTDWCGHGHSPLHHSINRAGEALRPDIQLRPDGVR